MTTPLPFIDYASGDFESLKRSLVEYLRQRFPNDITDFTESQLGIAMLEQTAYAFELLRFMLDRQVNEIYVDTARERRSMLKISSLLGYKMSPAQAATVALYLDTDKLNTFAVGQEIRVLQGTQVEVQDIVFEVDRDYTIVKVVDGAWTVNGASAIPPGSPFVYAVQGQTIVENQFRANGSKFLTFTMSRSPLILNSMGVTVAAVPWTSVDSLVLGDLSNPSNQNIYEILLDENDLPTIRFGDGVTGAIPAEGSTIQVTYRVGGGVSGNVAANVISQEIPIQVYPLNGFVPVTDSIQVENTYSGSGGTEREDIERARFFAPAYARTTDRAITYNDYFALANGYSDGANGVVAKAGIIADPSDGISNTVTVYGWLADDKNNLYLPVGGSPQFPRWTALKNALKGFLDSRKVVTVYVQVADGNFVDVQIEAYLQINKSYQSAQVLAQAKTAIEELFRENRVRYGNELRVAWIYDALARVPGVISTHLVKPSPFVQLAESTGSPLVARDLERTTLGSQGTSGPGEVVLPTGRGDDFYTNYRIGIETSGTTPYQTRRIIDYVSATGVATLDKNWDTKPIVGDTFHIWHPRRIRLAASDTAVDGFYNNRVLTMFNIEHQTRTVITYTATASGPWDKIAIIDKDWLYYPRGPAAPVQGSTYKIYSDLKTIDSQALRASSITLRDLEAS